MRTPTIVATLALLAPAGLSAAPPALAAPAGFFIGAWVVQDVVGYSDISGGPAEAATLLGKTIRIGRRAIGFDAQTCRPPSGFTASIVDTAASLRENDGIARGDTGLPASTLLLDSTACPAVFRMDAHHILFGWDRVIARAVK